MFSSDHAADSALPVVGERGCHFDVFLVSSVLVSTFRLASVGFRRGSVVRLASVTRCVVFTRLVAQTARNADYRSRADYTEYATPAIPGS